MGLFSMAADSVKSAQMNSAAKQITEYQYSIQGILRNYSPFETLTPYDKQRVRNLVDLMESKLGYIENKMHTLDPFHLPLTFIIMPNGEQLAVTKYVMLHKDMVRNYRNTVLV